MFNINPDVSIMKIVVVKEELWPIWFEDDEEPHDWKLTDELDIDPRLWEDYKMARDKLIKLKDKIEEDHWK